MFSPLSVGPSAANGVTKIAKYGPASIGRITYSPT